MRSLFAMNCIDDSLECALPLCEHQLRVSPSQSEE